jgi:hypothetical protein
MSCITGRPELKKPTECHFNIRRRLKENLRVVSYLMPLSSSTQGRKDVEPATVVGQQLTPSQVLLQKESERFSNITGG